MSASRVSQVQLALTNMAVQGEGVCAKEVGEGFAIMVANIAQLVADQGWIGHERLPIPREWLVVIILKAILPGEQQAVVLIEVQVGVILRTVFTMNVVNCSILGKVFPMLIVIMFILRLDCYLGDVFMANKALPIMSRIAGQVIAQTKIDVFRE